MFIKCSVVSRIGKWEQEQPTKKFDNYHYVNTHPVGERIEWFLYYTQWVEADPGESKRALDPLQKNCAWISIELYI